jgi:hypothetical protein
MLLNQWEDRKFTWSIIIWSITLSIICYLYINYKTIIKSCSFGIWLYFKY